MANNGQRIYSNIRAGKNSNMYNGDKTETVNNITYNYAPTPTPSPGQPYGVYGPPPGQAYGHPPAAQAPYQGSQNTAQPHQRSVRDYTVGWICALPDPEWQASRMQFDEDHGDLPLNTTYSYVYGKIGVHNVVMGCLPEAQMGKANAAAVAAEMHQTFPALRFGLLVGVAGGVPSRNNDIRLGDVVVSRPDKEHQHGGVVQYDHGKAMTGGVFRPTGILNTPPTVLLAALGKVRSAFKGSQFQHYLDAYAEYKDDFPQYLRPECEDRLFEASYTHVSGQPTCDVCDPVREVRRPLRQTPKPKLHYGTIASGDQVMKDAIRRDEISSTHGEVMCFEMEAAGLMNHFPCLVIRGICDYCDSHKNKVWQPYAAAAAAAWAKELLRNITSGEMESAQ